jgi:hypothetical protein
MAAYDVHWLGQRYVVCEFGQSRITETRIILHSIRVRRLLHNYDVALQIAKAEKKWRSAETHPFSTTIVIIAL